VVIYEAAAHFVMSNLFHIGVRLLKLNVNPRGTYATNEIPVPHNPSTDADEIIVDNNGLSGWWSDEL
jgi:hypothetical protein